MHRLALVLGIRPDLIRASRVIALLRQRNDLELTFIWSGQHYSDNLKDVFIRDLDLPEPDVELGAKGTSDAELVGSIVARLAPVLEQLAPNAVVFLGDTNTVMGSIAASQLNIPIVHIEGCMRSYDWRMPEEKYRTVIDHLSDVIYTYFDEYKEQGVREGLNPRNIVVIQNLIVDVLQRYYFERREQFERWATAEFFSERGVAKGDYYLMTCHRRENVEPESALRAVLALIERSPRHVYFPASYRTQSRIEDFGLQLPDNTTMVDPVGYRELILLLVNSRGAITDSGTVVEETAILGVPSVQMRKSTERPQVYDCGSSVKFDPALPARYPADDVFANLELLGQRGWSHRLGDGRASERLVTDLVERLRSNTIRGHRPEDSHIDVSRSYREDGIQRE